MNMIEALQAVNDDPTKWCRPLTWLSMRVAFASSRNGYFITVPDPRGGRPAFLPTIEDLVAEWEVVEPSEVLQ